MLFLHFPLMPPLAKGLIKIMDAVRLLRARYLCSVRICSLICNKSRSIFLARNRHITGRILKISTRLNMLHVTHEYIRVLLVGYVWLCLHENDEIIQPLTTFTSHLSHSTIVLITRFMILSAIIEPKVYACGF